MEWRFTRDNHDHLSHVRGKRFLLELIGPIQQGSARSNAHDHTTRIAANVLYRLRSAVERYAHVIAASDIQFAAKADTSDACAIFQNDLIAAPEGSNNTTLEQRCCG